MQVGEMTASNPLGEGGQRHSQRPLVMRRIQAVEKSVQVVLQQALLPIGPVMRRRQSSNELVSTRLSLEINRIRS